MKYLENITDDHRHRSDIIENPGVRFTMVAINCLVIVLGALGNGFVLYFLIRYKRRTRNSTTRYLLINLAVCDFFVTTIHQPLRVLDILLPFATHGPVGITLTYCEVTAFFANLFASVGFHTLVLIGLERYLMICLPFKSKTWVTVKNTLKCIAAIWIIAIACVLPLPVHFTYIAQVSLSGTELDFCFADLFGEESSGWVIYFTIEFIMYYVFPVISLVHFYAMIFRTLNRDICELPTGDPGQARMVRKRKSLAKVLLSIAIIFVVLHSPYFIGFLMMTYGFKGFQNPIFGLLLAESLVTINSAIDPFIYCAQSRSFFKRKMFSVLSSSVEDRNSRKARSPLLSTYRDSTRSQQTQRSSRQNPRYTLRSVLDQQAADSQSSNRSASPAFLTVPDSRESLSSGSEGSSPLQNMKTSTEQNGVSRSSINCGYAEIPPDDNAITAHCESAGPVVIEHSADTEV